MKPRGLHYLVPVDFSRAAYRAAQYALLIARKAGGTITLLHVFEADAIPVSANPLVLAELIKRTEEIKEQKLKGLQDIIRTCGIDVEVEIMRGSFPESLLDSISRIRPDVLVIGRKSTRCSPLIAELLQNTSLHMLIVPGSSNPEIPQRALIAADLSDTAAGFEMMVKLLASMDQELALVQTTTCSDYERLQEKMKMLSKKFGVKARLIESRESARPEDILHILKRNSADWLCLVKKKTGRLARIFGRVHKEEITTLYEVPVLVIRE